MRLLRGLFCGAREKKRETIRVGIVSLGREERKGEGRKTLLHEWENGREGEASLFLPSSQQQCINHGDTNVPLLLLPTLLPILPYRTFAIGPPFLLLLLLLVLWQEEGEEEEGSLGHRGEEGRLRSLPSFFLLGSILLPTPCSHRGDKKRRRGRRKEGEN